MRLTIVATCSLNQWALDFEGNYSRIKKSIIISKQRGASYRTGPELEICGYGCNDHFYEHDTFMHSWEVLLKLLTDDELCGILVDVGMPVLHEGVRYNCRVVFLNKKILLIRPKLYLANDGNYREGRWFTPWLKHKKVADFRLHHIVESNTGQSSCPIGDAIISCQDARVGYEICEELFTPQSPHIDLSFAGVDIISNGSGSHHELRKLKTRVDLILHATAKCGAVYLYANQQGCDGERVYYDGCALIAMNGSLLGQGSQFSLDDIEVVTSTVDLDEVASYRSSISSRSMQAASSSPYPFITVNYKLCQNGSLAPTSPISPTYHTVEEEILLGPSCWLWDYLRRSGLKGFFLPLSGGIDSCSTALIVSSICRMVFDKYRKKDPQVVQDLEKIMKSPPNSHRDVAKSIFCTSYMGSSNSSDETRLRAKQLAEAIGSHHLECNIDKIYQSFVDTFQQTTDRVPKFAAYGGSNTENLALQNIQARSRMVLGYLLAQLVPWSQSENGGLLVLGSANVDECLRGYFTKYDCSSADLNPIGSISKVDLQRFVKYCMGAFNMPLLEGFLNATPTAELQPIIDSQIQKDEVHAVLLPLIKDEMGLTYEELSMFGRLRKIDRCGPVSAFKKLSAQWKNKLDNLQIAKKTMHFFKYYAINRHKMTTITPSYHAESYSPDDNRFDLRPFLYRTDWKWQFDKIEEMINPSKL